MTLILKPNYKYIWATGGDIVEPSDLKKQQGWTSEVPPFQYENWIQNRQDQYLAHINQRGIPAWDGQTEYEAGGLSYVQGSDGKIYKSVAASGPSTNVQNPTTDSSDTYWTIAFADVGAFLTQATADTRYLRIANNLSDINNAATARTNIGVVAATESIAGLLEIATDAEAQAFTANKAIDGAKLAAAFKGANSSLYDNGFQKLPSGLIIQWGGATTFGAGGIAVTFPIAFPNACHSVSAVANATAVQQVSVVAQKSNTAITLYAGNSASGAGVSIGIFWMAIGY